MAKKPMRFVSVDGEGITLPSGEHRYVILGNSDGDCLISKTGIGTLDAFAFLARTKRRAPDGILVGFYFGYDVNMILGDLPQAQLERLSDDGRCRWGGWSIDWISSKSFAARHPTEGSFSISDTAGFFQSSFVVALERWKAADAETIERIATMKNLRSSFTAKDLREMAAYCMDECRLHVGMMDNLREAFLDAGFLPSGWHGAGAAASGLLKREGVKHHLIPELDLPADAREMAALAYFGGRIELLQQGLHEEVSAVDLTSAYPAALVNMPTMIGNWGSVRKPRGKLDPCGIYGVEWAVPRGFPFGPFPFRSTGGSVWYPRHGKGFYHAVEIEAARRVFGDHVAVGAGMRFVPESDASPFGFVPGVFEQRAQAKRAGHASEKALKLALNSLYGKTAQRISQSPNGPPFRSLYWAGRTTAWTRARLMLKAAEAPESVVMFATDGVLSTRALESDSSGILGSWDATDLGELLTIHPGVYWTKKGLVRTRGFGARELTREQVRDAWLTDGWEMSVPYSARRFMGIKVALARNRLDLWRKWLMVERTLRAHAPRKLPDPRHEAGIPVHRLSMIEGERFDGWSLPSPQVETREDPEDELLDVLLRDMIGSGA